MIPRLTNTVVDPVPLTKAPALRPTPWTDEQVAELTQLWATGLSSQEIANRMGVTKNAVVGKARRLNLPWRREPKKIEPRQANVMPETGEAIYPPFPKRGGCLWARGSRETGFDFCGDPVMEGKSYCPTHAAKAYVKVRDYTPEEKEAHRLRWLKIKAGHERAAKERASAG